MKTKQGLKTAGIKSRRLSVPEPGGDDPVADAFRDIPNAPGEDEPTPTPQAKAAPAVPVAQEPPKISTQEVALKLQSYFLSSGLAKDELSASNLVIATMIGYRADVEIKLLELDLMRLERDRSSKPA